MGYKQVMEISNYYEFQQQCHHSLQEYHDQLKCNIEIVLAIGE